MIRNPKNAEHAAAGRRRARARPTYLAVARQMGGTVSRESDYALITFSGAGEAEAYASWLRRVRRRLGIVYTGGTVVTVRRR